MTNSPKMPPIPAPSSSPLPRPSVDQHAEAIAQVTAMRDTITKQSMELSDLRRDLQTERDRVALMIEERARYRSDSLACRAFVVKLATIQEAINELTKGARNVLSEMAMLDMSETPAEAVDEEQRRLDESLAKINKIVNGTPANGNPVSSV